MKLKNLFHIKKSVSQVKWRHGEIVGGVTVGKKEPCLLRPRLVTNCDRKTLIFFAMGCMCLPKRERTARNHPHGREDGHASVPLLYSPQDFGCTHASGMTFKMRGLGLRP